MVRSIDKMLVERFLGLLNEYYRRAGLNPEIRPPAPRHALPLSEAELRRLADLGLIVYNERHGVVYPLIRTGKGIVFYEDLPEPLEGARYPEGATVATHFIEVNVEAPRLLDTAVVEFLARLSRIAGEKGLEGVKVCSSSFARRCVDLQPNTNPDQVRARLELLADSLERTAPKTIRELAEAVAEAYKLALARGAPRNPEALTDLLKKLVPATIELTRKHGRVPDPELLLLYANALEEQKEEAQPA